MFISSVHSVQGCDTTRCIYSIHTESSILAWHGQWLTVCRNASLSCRIVPNTTTGYSVLIHRKGQRSLCQYRGTTNYICNLSHPTAGLCDWRAERGQSFASWSSLLSKPPRPSEVDTARVGIVNVRSPVVMRNTRGPLDIGTSDAVPVCHLSRRFAKVARQRV